MNRARRIAIVWAIVCLLLGIGSESTIAQTDDVLWAEPVNLSRSGAAEAPTLVVSPRNQRQVFWWDRFDGIMTSYTTGGNRWSSSQRAPIELAEVQNTVRGLEIVTTTIEAMPQIVGVGEVAYALWLGAPAEETGARPLLYSYLRISAANWTSPESMAESVTTWRIVQDAQNVLHLVYHQPQKVADSPAGIYHRRSTDGGASWSEPIALHTSLYVRLWTAKTTSLSIASDGRGNVLVGWDDPRQGRAFYALSTDGGVSWGEPSPVGDEMMVGQRPQFIPLSESSRMSGRSKMLMLWSPRGAASTCTLMQQLSEDGGETWSASSRVLADLTVCSAQIAVSPVADGRMLAMLNEGTDRLLLAAWDGSQWSKTRSLSFSFENPETGTTNYLDALQAHVTQNDTLAVVGQGQDGEIWVLQGQVDVENWIFAPPSPWSSLSIVSESDVHIGFPAAATDAEGRVHIAWGAISGLGQPDTALYYSRWDETSWSRPTVILDEVGGISQEPAMVFAGGVLHAVWSSGGTGTVFYSKVYPRDAYAAGSWSAPYMMGEIDSGSSPVIIADLLGRLHVVYAVPLNEGRGIYYTRSDDNGESWSAAVQIFDAAVERWSGVNHPSVTIDGQGIVHAVWVRTPLPGNGDPQGVYYSRSTDHGKTWSDAMILTDGGYDWPQIVSTLAGQVVVVWQDLANNAVQYRVSDDSGQTWGYVSQIPGLQVVEGRVTLASDNADSVHLTALDVETGVGVELLHLVFTEGQWVLLEPVELDGVYSPVGGAALSVASELGLIDVVGLGSRLVDGELLPSLWHTRRSIESKSAFPPDFAPEPTPTQTPGPTPAPTPTPRPAVNPNAPQSSAPVIALGPISLPILALAGMGGALLLVVSVVIWQVMKRK